MNLQSPSSRLNRSNYPVSLIHEKARWSQGQMAIVGGLVVFTLLSLGVLFLTKRQTIIRQPISTNQLQNYRGPSVTRTPISGRNVSPSPTQAPNAWVDFPPNLTLEISSTDISPADESQSDFVGIYSKYQLSSDGNLFFYYSPISSYPPDDVENPCKYAIYKRTGGNSFALTNYQGKGPVWCESEMGMISGDFYRWVNSHSFLLKNTKGNLKLIDLNNFIKSQDAKPIFSYDSSLYKFVSVDNSLSNWLLMKTPTAQGIVYFSLVNKQNKPLIDDLQFTAVNNDYISIGGPVLYDNANNGFLFAEEKNVLPIAEDKATVEFKFLSLDTLNLKTVYTTKPTPIQHRGCGAGFDYLTSTPGNVRVSIACINIGDSDYDRDGFVSIKL